MHGYSRKSRSIAVTAAVAATVAGTMTAAAGTAHAAPRKPAWCKPTGALSARAMPQQVKLAECDLRGRTVHGPNGVSAVVPADGTSLVAHTLRTTGEDAELRIEVDDRAGAVSITSSGGRVPAGRPRTSRAPTDPCRDGAYNFLPAKWPRGTTVGWRYHPGGNGLPMSPISQGVSNMVGAHTDCVPGGRFTPAPNVGARNTGSSVTPPNLTRGAACGIRNGVNTFGWLAMTTTSPSVLAATCIWFRGGTTVESDVALQEFGKRWWTGGTCTPGSYSAEAVATHETGHVLGLEHVTGANHSGLTMAPSVGACDDGLATLGKGDYDGLIALYGGR